jgi:hypothetical protein
MKTLNIAMREEIKYMGDINALLKLKFYKVPLEWLKKILPKNIERVLNVLPQRDLEDIVIPNQEEVVLDHQSFDKINESMS